MKNNIFILLLICFISSCCPTDDRMVFVNTSSERVFTRMIFINDDIEGTMIGLRQIESNNDSRLGKLYTWESEFDNVKDSVLSVIVFRNYAFLDDKYEKSNKIKSDSLLRIGDYFMREYTYNELIEKDWKIKYPDDVFKKGSPLVLNRKENKLNSGSKILK